MFTGIRQKNYSLKVLVRNNISILLIYLVFLLTAAFFLLNYGKIQIHLYLNQAVGNDLVNKFFYYITFLGDGLIAVILILFILFYNVRLGICTLLSFLVAAVTTNLIKYGLYDEVVRPWFVFKWIVHSQLNVVEVDDLHIHNSFPSGHATQAFAIFLCLAFYAKSNVNKLLFMALALLTAFSRVYLSQHWLVDITIGSVIGSIVAFLFYWFLISKNKFPSLDVPLLKIRKS